MSKVHDLSFYLRKHGAFGLCWIALGRAWTKVFGQKEWLYVMDLANAEGSPGKDLDGLVLCGFRSEGELDARVRGGMLRFKSDLGLQRFLERWFGRGATLWVAERNGEVLGVQWTLERGIGGFYSVPVLKGEVVIVAVEVFPAYRGQGIYPWMAKALLPELRKLGYKRAYLKVAARNYPMLRSMAKTPYEKVAKVYTRGWAGKSLTVWDMLPKDPACSPADKARDLAYDSAG